MLGFLCIRAVGWHACYWIWLVMQIGRECNSSAVYTRVWRIDIAPIYAQHIANLFNLMDIAYRMLFFHSKSGVLRKTYLLRTLVKKT